MINEHEKEKVCPICLCKYREYPALSRYSNIEICPDCGLKESLTGFFWRKKMETVAKVYNKYK